MGSDAPLRRLRRYLGFAPPPEPLPRPPLPRRPLRAQVRFRVLAGVVGVTLLALAAFDLAAITALRTNLDNQTDQSLQTVLALTRPRLPTLLPPGQWVPVQRSALAGGDSPVTVFPSGKSTVSSPKVQQTYGVNWLTEHSVLGEYFIAYVLTGGQKITLEIGADLGAHPQLPADLTALAAGDLATTVPGQDGSGPVRVRAAQTPGGVLVAGESLNQVDTTIDQDTWIVVVGSVAVVLLIGCGVFLVLRRGLRPVEAMAGQADRITAGDLTARVGVQRPGSEVGRLGAALNGMLGRIETSVREREADRELTQRFFADASHELRNPLASLRANAELYQQGALREREQVDEVMRRIALETRRMSSLVDDMLRLARLDQHPDRRREPVDLTALILDGAAAARSADPERAWRVAVEPGLDVTGDGELLRRAVDNLLANIRVHTPPGTAARITARREDGGGVGGGAGGEGSETAEGGETAKCTETAERTETAVLIDVTDDGPGPAPDQLPRIFDRFYRAGGSSPGSGLGLSIVAEAAAAHGGTVRAELVEPHGLHITVRLPAAS